MDLSRRHGKRIQMIDGNNENNFTPSYEDAKSWQYIILYDLNKAHCDEWLLKLEINLDKNQS